MSYLIDVYKKTVPCQRNVADLALYVMLFPQLIAGPIVRYSDVEREIGRRRTGLKAVSYTHLESLCWNINTAAIFPVLKAIIRR